MKYILIFLFTVIPSALCIAQYEPGMIRLDYSDSSGEKGFTKYIYNGNVLPYKAIWSLEDGSRYSVNYHYFNKKGQMIRKSRDFSDSLHTEQEFSYNKLGDLVAETFKRSDGVEGSVSYSYINRRLQSAECKGLNGWFFGTIIYRYDEGGLKKSAQLIREGKVIGKITYESDTKGRLSRERWIFDSGLTQNYDYQYVEKGCKRYKSSNVFIASNCNYRLSKEYYDFSGQGGPSSFFYDDEGKLIKKEYVYRDTLRTVTTFNYDEKGFLTSSLRQFTDGRQTVFSYKFDSCGRMLERQFKGPGIMSGYERYHYDENGKLTDGEYNNFDQWLTGSLVFCHDIFDKISKADYHGSDGLKANLDFSYNDSDQLIEILWTFPSGKTQRYSFAYQN